MRALDVPHGMRIQAPSREHNPLTSLTQSGFSLGSAYDPSKQVAKKRLREQVDRTDGIDISVFFSRSGTVPIMQPAVDDTHQALVGAAVDQRQAAGGDLRAQPPRGLRVLVGKAEIRAAENRDLA